MKRLVCSQVHNLIQQGRQYVPSFTDSGTVPVYHEKKLFGRASKSTAFRQLSRPFNQISQMHYALTPYIFRTFQLCPIPTRMRYIRYPPSTRVQYSSIIGLCTGYCGGAGRRRTPKAQKSHFCWQSTEESLFPRQMLWAPFLRMCGGWLNGAPYCHILKFLCYARN